MSASLPSSHHWRIPIGHVTFIELPTRDLEATQTFYSAAFGWNFTGFGPTYAATMQGPVDIGLQADVDEAPRAPLPVILVSDLEHAQLEVQRLGGTITQAIFSFPGGRRFHFTDPSGNELAAMSPD